MVGRQRDYDSIRSAGHRGDADEQLQLLLGRIAAGERGGKCHPVFPLGVGVVQYRGHQNVAIVALANLQSARRLWIFGKRFTYGLTY